MPKGLILNIDTTKSEFQNPMVELRQGDGNYQSLYVTVTDNGDPFDLAGWTVSFMGTSAGSHKIIDANVLLDSTVVGAFTYTPTKAWGQDEGEFKNAYFKFVKSDETASGASFRVNVLNAVDLTDEEAQDYISVVDALIDQVKTNIDSKLADTQKTLSDTQTQATTVQGNVDDLNTIVNELKQQNNNLLTTDNTWSGNNKFSKIINGDISGNAATADKATMADSATSAETSNDPNAVKLTGNQTIEGNKTFSNIISGSINGNASTANKAITADSAKTANDPNAVHLTSDQTISGNNTFTGSTTFSQPINGVTKRGNVGNAANMNDYLYTGDYILNGPSGMANYPSGANNYGYLHVEVVNSTTIIQTIKTADLTTYIRSYGGTNPVWSAWKKIVPQSL